MRTRSAIRNQEGFSFQAGLVIASSMAACWFSGQCGPGTRLVSSAQNAHDFEAALQRAGKSIDTKYYKTGAHNSLFTDPVQHRDEVRRDLRFLRQHDR